MNNLNINREPQTSPRSELGTTTTVNEGKYKKIKADTAGVKAAKIIAMAGGIAFFVAKTSPGCGGPERLKDKVGFGFTCLVASSLLYNAMGEYKEHLKRITEERANKNA